MYGNWTEVRGGDKREDFGKSLKNEAEGNTGVVWGDGGLWKRLVREVKEGVCVWIEKGLLRRRRHPEGTEGLDWMSFRTRPPSPEKQERIKKGFQREGKIGDECLCKKKNLGGRGNLTKGYRVELSHLVKVNQREGERKRRCRKKKKLKFTTIFRTDGDLLIIKRKPRIG